MNTRDNLAQKDLNVYWSLFCHSTGSYVDGLTISQIKSLISTIDISKHQDWLVWSEGETDWSELSDRYDEILSAADASYKIPPIAPAIENQPTRKAKVDLRMTKRFKRDIKVTVNFNNEKIEALTSDISLLGMKLLLPQSLNLEPSQQVTITLHVHPTRLVLDCEAIPQQVNADTSYLQFKILPGKYMVRLSEILAGKV
jgi:hypothetical protein